MKKFLFISLFFFLFSGCEKEELNQEGDVELLNVATEFPLLASSNEGMVPLKGEIIEVPDLSYGFLNCGIPDYFPPAHYDDISGNLTHLGNVEGGFADLFNCRMEMRDEMPFLLVDAKGEFMSANGDVMFYEGELLFSLLYPSLNSSTFIITGGTGRWRNAKGNFAGTFEQLEDGTLWYGVDGYVSPPGKNK